MGLTKLEKAVRSGDQAVALKAVRDRIAQELHGCEAKDVAPLTKQLAAVIASIEKLAPKKESAVDELAEKRRKRREGQAADSG